MYFNYFSSSYQNVRLRKELVKLKKMLADKDHFIQSALVMVEVFNLFCFFCVIQWLLHVDCVVMVKYCNCIVSYLHDEEGTN